MKSNNFLSRIKTVFNRQFLIGMVMICAMAVPTFASSGGDSIVELDNWADKILELFQSSWVKAILLVALIVEAIGMVLAGQQGGGGQMLKKFAPWIIGTIILLCSSSICSYFLDGMTFEVAQVQIQQTVDSVMALPAVGAV